MSDVKQVKVDNWGIYFLQRLKHFFNRTDYCDLTLQFQDNAQLKVHRLVLNACTEYFEILERTCEMYEDCLVMPEDLQADVVVPIVNFMYTGQLEFRMEALDKLYQTSQVMNMPVLSKLLEAHRGNCGKRSQAFKARGTKNLMNSPMSINQSFSPSSAKRSYTKAFDNNKTKSFESNKNFEANKTSQPTRNENSVIYREKKFHHAMNNQSKSTFKPERVPSPIPLDSSRYNKKLILGDPRPTRYELPEELDTDNIFDNSFTNISYTSQPLMVHPETTKQYSKKKSHDPKKGLTNTTVDIVECTKVPKNENIFDDEMSQSYDDMPGLSFLRLGNESSNTNQLFDQMLDSNESAKVTIESKDKQASNMDHAKIISEVLKKYPHLVKSNKNIKLKILNSPAKTKKPHSSPNLSTTKKLPQKDPNTMQSYTYETDVLDSKEAAKLIAMGAENTKGPWICLICGTPGRALNFTSYYNFRRHLVEVHQEKPVSTICEYCGIKAHKRNYLLHHIYSKHGVPPPPQYNFPKCNQCDYIALTEGFLVKHKLTHNEERKMIRCPVCFDCFGSPTLLSRHMQNVHTTTNPHPNMKTHMQCNYCMKVFIRQNNYLAHLKISHKEQAIRDGVIVDSDEENEQLEENSEEIKPTLKYELPIEQEFDDEMQYQKSDNSNIMAKKPKVSVSSQKILNPGYSVPKENQVQKINNMASDENNDYLQEDKSTEPHEQNIIFIDDNEYIMKDNQLIPRKTGMKSSQYIISDYIEDEPEQNLQNFDADTTTSMEFSDIHSAEIIQQPKMALKKSANIAQPIQIVVSNEEEYKALMASNHSIIFDDSDPNKTLTVLTAAQNPTLNTAPIDLDNNQSNDMMIIQDDYPLSVSEAVPTDNSKYVVVYSHAMEHEDPNNKQYEIITSQELGAQYVQSSAVLTQNFETITTTTSVVSANVIDTQIEETWSQNVQQNTENQALVQVTPDNSVEIVNDTNITQVNIAADLSDLPEVDLSKNAVSEEHIQENIEHSNSLNSDAVPDISETIPAIESEENQLDNTTEPIDTESSDMPIESQSEKITTLTEPVQIELVPEHDPNVTYTDNVGTIQEHQSALSLSTEEHNSDEIIEESNSIPETDNTDSVEPTLNIVEEVTSEENTVPEEMPANENEVAPVVEAKKQIQNLTSEWSEDEYDTVVEECTEDENAPKNPDSENPINEEPELEESIENIEQEVHKEISGKGLLMRKTDEEKSFEEVQTQNEPVVPIETVNVEVTHEKISSLLNDWEDNDSQEENSMNENDNPMASEPTETNGPAMSEAADEEAISSVPVTKDDPKKDDKIKSLVSDWDDDDEENKE